MFSSKWKVIAAKETFASDNFNFICHLSPYEYNKLVYKMLAVTDGVTDDFVCHRSFLRYFT